MNENYVIIQNQKKHIIQPSIRDQRKKSIGYLDMRKKLSRSEKLDLRNIIWEIGD